MSALPSGSYLDLADGTSYAVEGREQAQQDFNESGAVPYVLHRPEEIASFFDGLVLVEPGVVSCPRWRPGPPQGLPAEVAVIGG